MPAIAPEGPNAQQIAYWNAQAADTWVSLTPQLDHELGDLGRAAMWMLQPAAGERIIDVGCGAGGTSLELARKVGPRGQVIGVDISESLLALARKRALQDAAERVSFHLADSQTFVFPPAEADGVFSRFGVMFFADPTAAFGNLRRALKPGGRLSFVCWREVERNDCMDLPYRAALKAVPELVAPPGGNPLAPGPFAFADGERVRGILEGAGFNTIAVSGLEQPISTGPLDEAVNLSLRIGALGMRLRENRHLVPAAAAAVREELAKHIKDGEVRLGSSTWLVTAKA